MAGTLTLSTLSDGTNSTSATNPIMGSAKAWVNFNGTGTVAINNSYNVSSITDNGTGDYTVNFTNAMPNANYSVVSSGKFTSNAGASLAFSTSLANFTGNPATTSARIVTGYGNNTNLFDFEVVTVSIFSS
jgi:hypothetical protein